MLRHGSLFSGIGGFDLAAEWCGWENVFHCEWNEFGQRVLKHYWPNSDSYGDITKTDFTKYNGAVDIISGGFPCQPYSSAGKRKGKEDERHLWPEMLRVIREVQPRYVVGENVFGLLNWNGGLVFDEVHADLAAEGYETQAVVIPAAAVNAPHGRDRVWFVARNATNTLPIRLQQCEDARKMGGGQTKVCGEGREFTNGIETNGKISNATDTMREGLQRGQNINERQELNGQWRGNGAFIGAIGENFSKQPKSNFEQFPTQSPICGGDDGLPRKLDGVTFSKWRNESIKAYGNAIVPQVAYEIFKTIDFLEQQK